MVSRNKVIAVLLVLVLGVAIRLDSFNGLSLPQSISISDTAWRVFNVDGTAGLIQYISGVIRGFSSIPIVQWPLVVVLGVCYRLLGVSELVSVLPPLFLYFASGLLLYSLGRFWFDHAVGLLGFFLWVTVPAGIFLSMQLLPSASLLFILILLVLFLSLAWEKLGWSISLSVGLVKSLWVVIAIVAILVLLNPTPGLNQYYYLLLPLDNFALLPLFILSLLHASRRLEDNGTRFVLLWLGVTALAIMVLSYLRSPSWLEASVGRSEYWLILMAPSVLLIAAQIVMRFRHARLENFLPILAIMLSLLFGVLAGVESLLVVSRIATGVTVVLVFICLTPWAAVHQQGRFWIYSLLLFFCLSALSLAKAYDLSYAESRTIAGEAWHYLADEPSETVVYVSDDDLLFRRVRYLNKYGLADGKRFMVRELPLEFKEIPPRSFVLFPVEYFRHTKDWTHESWFLLETFTVGESEWLLFLVP